VVPEQVFDASVSSAVTSCIRPGLNAPSHSIRPSPSLTAVAFLVFCLRLPDTNARRLGRLALGRLTCTSVPSTRSLTPSDAA